MWENFWNLRVNERLTRWKLYRQKISELPLDQAVAEVADIWGQAPYVLGYLDASSPGTWPSPWELLAENHYCDLAIALGMLHTLYFSAHKSESYQLGVYYDSASRERVHVISVNNNQYILNYWPRKVVNTKQFQKIKLKELHIYSEQDLGLDQY